MNRVGANLKEPLPGSTNYLGAYDRYGNLVRANAGWQRGGPQKQEAPQGSSVEGEGAGEGEQKSEVPEGQESADELELSVRRDEEKNRAEAAEQEQKLPPETAEDLRPFPMNRFFRSQPVLSEDLREAIYQRVKRDGATVPLASVEFGVSNERVGAVVRLKQMEKDWISQVCPCQFLAHVLLHDETLYNIRLVFKTSHMVTKLNYALSDHGIRYVTQ